jgi:uncharacterized membrane protein YbaN (DUF454 family)
MTDNNPLWHDIIKFSRNKNKLAIGFIVLGILGLILPMIPGILFLGVGIFIIKPEWYESFRRWFEK